MALREIYYGVGMWIELAKNLVQSQVLLIAVLEVQVLLQNRLAQRQTFTAYSAGERHNKLTRVQQCPRNAADRERNRTP
jgi:hypothetical protein